MAFCQSHLQSMGISVGHARLFGYLPVHFVFATSGVSENNVDKTSKNASIHAWSAGCVLACGVTARSPRSFPRAPRNLCSMSASGNPSYNWGCCTQVLGTGAYLNKTSVR